MRRTLLRVDPHRNAHEDLPFNQRTLADARWFEYEAAQVQ
jgi:hypothetical protein